MEYRKLGKTGFKVSALGFGASSLGGVFKPVEEEAAIRTVHAALDLGINFIDTAPFYGLTRSEVVLGKALKTVGRDRYVLATKVGRYGHRMEDFDFSAERVTRSVDESLQRLGCGHIDIIQVHDLEFGDITQILEETLPALRRVQKSGKVRFVGITALPLNHLVRVLEKAEADTLQSYCHYVLNDTSLMRVVGEFEKRDMGIISSAPLAMGLLTEQGPPKWHPAPKVLREAVAKASAYCREKGGDLSRLALQFSCANPRLHTCVVSTSNPDRIRKNVRTLEEPMDETLLAGVREILKPVDGVTWVQGRHENNDPEVVAAELAEKSAGK